MDFGAVVCKPAAPLCIRCVFRRNCVAYLDNKVNKLPVKEKKVRIKKRWFYYLVAEYKNKIAIQQRTGKDIWQDLFEFLLIETRSAYDSKRILKEAEKKKLLIPREYELISISPLFKQQLSHQLIAGQFISLRLKQKPDRKDGYLLVSKNKLNQYAFPKIIWRW